MDRMPVSSSNLRSVGYDVATQTLEIEFHNGGVYEYYNVPITTYHGLLGALSKGKYFHAHIKSVYRYSKIN